jgi:hypothetical protein
MSVLCPPSSTAAPAATGAPDQHRSRFSTVSTGPKTTTADLLSEDIPIMNGGRLLGTVPATATR